MCSLLRRQVPRQLDVYCRIQIAVLAALPDRRHAVTLQPEHLSILRRRWNLEPERLAAERLDVHLAAEHRRRQRNRHTRVEVSAFPLELRMRGHADPQIEIT